MIILHLLYLLLSITAATPISSNESPSSPLHKRDISCYEMNGRNIIPNECSEALRHMREHLAYMGAVSGPSEHIVGPFSRQPSDIRFLLPTFFRTSTCSIGVDTIEPYASLSTFWSTKVAAAEAILNRCVAPRAIGGEARTSDGFIVIVVNEQNLSPNLRNLWDACLRTGLRVDILACTGVLAPSMRRYSTGR